MIDKKLQGKRNRAAGQRFENLVRKDLESKGWIILKNPNNLINNKFTQGKSKYNPFTKRLMMNSGGFPDFIAFHFNPLDYEKYNFKTFDVIGVESKVNGILDKEEKEKCKWLLENKIFNKILIAKKIKVGRKIEVEYNEFKT